MEYKLFKDFLFKVQIQLHKMFLKIKLALVYDHIGNVYDIDNS